MKRIAVTMGEPGGIGPEVALRASLDASVVKKAETLLVGDMAVFEEAAGLIEPPPRLRAVRAVSGISRPEPGTLNVIDAGRFRGYEKGRPTPEGGEASAACIKIAVELCTGGDADALATAPISKEALRGAGYPFDGHTEMLAALTGAKDYAMMLVGGPGRGRRLRVILVSIHKPLGEAPSLVTKASVLKTIRLAMRACRMLSIREPAIAVAGLNPHAGEGGLFGGEEGAVILPAIEEAWAEGIPATGPYPPDTVYLRALRGEFDIVVSMYHDQGLIPLKLVSFEKGVNVTVGLPIIRTSPDHGTAYDIAWEGKADPSSMAEAIKLASSLRLA